MRLSGRKPSSFTRRWRQRPRVVLVGLIGLNIAVFITQLFLDAYQPGFVREYLGLSGQGIHQLGWQFHRDVLPRAGTCLAICFLYSRARRGIDIGQRQFSFAFLAGDGWRVRHLFVTGHFGLFALGWCCRSLFAYATILRVVDSQRSSWPSNWLKQNICRGALMTPTWA